MTEQMPPLGSKERAVLNMKADIASMRDAFERMAAAHAHNLSCNGHDGSLRDAMERQWYVLAANEAALALLTSRPTVAP